VTTVSETLPEGNPLLAGRGSGARLVRALVRPVRRVFGALERVAPGLAGRIAVLLFRIVRRHPMPPRERAWLEGARQGRLELDGRPLAYREWGEGPAVLLTHGWEGRGSQMGAFAGPLAAAGFRVVALDAPAHGDSAGHLSSLPQFAAAVRCAADAFGPLHGLVGHSFGAAGAGWAARSGAVARRLVFIAAPGDLGLYIRWFGELIGLGPRGRRAMEERLARLIDAGWDEARNATTIAADATPLLVVHDRSDFETPYDGGERIAAAWPAARMMSTEGLGHRRILRAPAVIEAVVGFLSA